VRPDEKLPVETALAILLAVIRRGPAVLFQRIGGDVEFVVREGDAIVNWTFTTRPSGAHVDLERGKPPGKPVVRVGIRQGALTRLVQGTLDVEWAFRDRRLAIEGEPTAVQRFCACFLPPAATSAVGVRTGR
jgi:hypothetical protein